jgi:diguanylate cyclase (GGDEF)-like protein/PAS domain S-box-containing protein
MTSASGPAKRPRVLVAAVDPELRGRIRAWLSQGDAVACDVEEAPDATALLDTVPAGGGLPDVLVVDRAAGTVDLLARLLAHAPGLDVVLLTAEASGAADREGDRLGLADVLEHGELTPRRVRRCVAQVLRRQADRELWRRRSADQDADRALLQSRARLQAILDNSPAVMFLKDLDGRYEFVNPAFGAFFGKTPEELRGLSDHDVFPAGFAQELQAIDAGVLATGRAVEAEEEVPDGDGIRTYASIKFPLRDHDGALTGVCGIAFDVTARKEAELRLAASEHHHRQILAQLPGTLVSLFDRDLRCTLLQGQYLHENGLDHDALIGCDAGVVGDPEDAAVLLQPMRRALQGEQSTIRYTARHTGRTLLVQVLPYRDERRAIVGVVNVARDITTELTVQEQRRQAEERFRVAFDSAPIGMAILALDGRLIQVNEALTEILGHGSEALTAMAPFAFVHPEDAALVGAAYATLGPQSADLSHEHRIVAADGHTAWTHAQVTLITDEHGAPLHALMQVQDITERRRFEERLQHMADHDPLTGLLNRRGLEQALERHLATIRVQEPRGALLVLDLDGFKYVNDTLGHAAGDELIVTCAGALRERLRATDVLARLGGDEFAVLLPDSDEADACAVAAAVVEAVRRQTAAGVGRRPLGDVTASVGVALLTSGHILAEELLTNADLAMYDAKDAGKDGYSVYAGARYPVPKIRSQMTWVQRIASALEEDRFVLHAQPILDLARHEVALHEVLVRMLDDDGAVVPPSTFLPIAERFGLIADVDRWVLRHSITAMGVAAARGQRLPLSVNVSGPSTADPALPEFVAAQLAAARADPADLTVELTETAAVADIPRARRFAEALRENGSRFALDDFGAGFGSFYYLKHLPFDLLKIDGQFVKDALANPTDQLIIAAVTGIAAGMGKQTIAEYVPDDRHVEMLVQRGVTFGQGFFLGRPRPLQELVGQAPAAGRA